MKRTIYLCSALLMGVLMPSNVDAQSFELTAPFTNLPALHRCTPSVGDFNNDGLIDVYQGGENWSAGMSWQVQGYLWQNLGGGAFKGINSNIYTENHYTDTTKTTLAIPAGMDANGNFLAYGLPPSIRNMGRFIDYNNDGNLDFFITGSSDNDYQVTGQPDNAYALLYRNTGAANNYQYVLADNTTFSAGGNEHDGNNAENNNSVAFADYDKDGYVDILQQSYHKWFEGDQQFGEREVALFHNNGDGTFTRMNIFNPIPYDKNPHFDGGIFDTDPVTFENVAKKNILPMSHGAVAFGDLNNDGYPDIIATGYCNGTNGGPTFVMYKNNGDGTFDEVDLSNEPFRGVNESDLVLADMNNDGWLDIVSFGTGNFDGKAGDIYYNNGSNKPFDFTLSKYDQSGLYGFSEANTGIFDINHDGLLDIVAHGWTNSTGSWGTHVFLQNNDHTFTHNSELLDTSNSGGWSFGDFEGKNQMDIVMTGYLNYPDGSSNCNTLLYKNLNDGNTAPTAPSNVIATTEGQGKIKVTWDAANDDQCDQVSLGYNVYVKNETTGETSMLIPADIQTGKIKSYAQMQCAIISDNLYSYEVKVPANGNYTVGVQAIDPSFVGGPFATAQVQVTTSVKKVEANTYKVMTVQNGIIVKSSTNQAVKVFNANGALVASGNTNTVLPVTGKGVFVVKANTKVYKIIK